MLVDENIGLEGALQKRLSLKFECTYTFHITVIYMGIVQILKALGCFQELNEGEWEHCRLKSNKTNALR